MTRRATILIASMVALSATASGPAMADVYYLTYTGTASGIDTNGVFGSAGATLSNVAYTTTYSYNTSLFGNATQNSGPGFVEVGGGSEYGKTTPILSAFITINGNTYSQSALYSGTIQLANTGSYTSLYDYAASSSSNHLYDTAYPLSFVTPSLTALQSFAIPAGTGGGGFYYNGESLSLHETYFALTNTAPPPPVVVPEPASLALLAGAAGVLAAALGTRRSMSVRDVGMSNSQSVA